MNEAVVESPAVRLSRPRRSAHGAELLAVRPQPGVPASGAALAARTNKRGLRGSADEVLAGADVLLGLSGPGAVSAAAVRTMAPNAIVFAMANPVPEVHPEHVQRDVAIIATGRTDYPNQINNVLAFPGAFKGALAVRVRTVNEEMKLAAARDRAHHSGTRTARRLHRPERLQPRVAESVAEARAAAVVDSGVARRPPARARYLTRDDPIAHGTGPGLTAAESERAREDGRRTPIWRYGRRRRRRRYARARRRRIRRCEEGRRREHAQFWRFSCFGPGTQNPGGEG
ncbi:MAG: malic enzyme-like NAD(P)-binding protein [Thermoleophilaceae bacterium]